MQQTNTKNEYKTMPDLMGKGIHEESRRRIKFDHIKNSIYTNENLSKMRRMQSSGILRYKRITQS